MWLCPSKRGTFGHRDRQAGTPGEHQGSMQAEVGVMLLQRSPVHLQK